MKIEWKEAHPGNYQQGRNGVTPDHVVLHVADGTYEGTLNWFAMPACDVSAHYTVAADGRIGQSVSEHNTAWHSGKSEMNRRSIGIEHEGKQPGWAPTETQLQASAQLVAAICQRWGIPVDREHIIGHCDVDPTRAARRNCPGAGWPWDKFLGMVKAALGDADPAHKASPADRETVRLFHSGTNELLGTGTRIAGTDKVYIPEAMIAALRATRVLPTPPAK